MLAKCYSGALSGVDARTVEIEVYSALGPKVVMDSNILMSNTLTSHSLTNQVSEIYKARKQLIFLKSMYFIYFGLP